MQKKGGDAEEGNKWMDGRREEVDAWKKAGRGSAALKRKEVDKL